MTTYGLPLFLEDKTGLITSSDFADIYDRSPFLRVCQSISPSHNVTVQVFQLNRFASNQSSLPTPTVVLEFGANHALGTMNLRHGPPLAMDHFLKKTEMNGSSLTRSFRASDGIKYTWGFRTTPDQEWTCTNASTLDLVAHYDLKTPGEPAYTTSGNVLTVYEDFQSLAVELLASLIIMRHIAQYHL